MRAVCNTETFGKKLALVSRGVSARSTIQLLGGILLEASEGLVKLSATDMEISVQTSSPAEVEKVSRSYSRDETRPVLTGILIIFEDSRVRMVTTDSYRLSIKETELATTSFEGSREAIIPARAMQEVSRIFSSSDEDDVEVALSENQALFRIGDVVLGTRLIDGNFPEYRRLLPGGFEREISVSREELIGTLRRVNLFAARQTPPVPLSLSFSQGSVEVIVRNGEIGDAHEKLEADSEDEFLISFNPGYLLDGVSAIDSENVVFKLNEPLKPGLIVPEENGEDPDFLYLIMPMRDPSRG